MNNPHTIRPQPLNTSSDPIVNILTVDVEDWYQSTCDRGAPISDRVIGNTRALLQLFDECDVQATFFVLGLVCESYPHLIEEIMAQGHELASHGYAHQPIHRMSRSGFEEDLQRSLDLIQHVTGEPVYGYRAPDFSIDENTLWALEVLAENGIHYDSSIFPCRNARYGFRGWYRFPHQIEINDCRAIIEVPLSTLSVAGRALPFVGGGYSRLLPASLLEAGIRRLNRGRQCAVVYLHPYEIDTQEMSDLRDKVPFGIRLSQGLNRRRVPSRLRHLLGVLEFSTVRQALDFAPGGPEEGG